MSVVELKRWGNSQALRLSKKILKEVSISDKDIDSGNVKFDLSIEGEKIILKPKKKLTKMEKLFIGYENESNFYTEEIDWGEPIGEEIW